MKKKPKLVKPPRTDEQVQERMRQSRAAGKHGKRDSDRMNEERNAIERELTDSD